MQAWVNFLVGLEILGVCDKLFFKAGAKVAELVDALDSGSSGC